MKTRSLWDRLKTRGTLLLCGSALLAGAAAPVGADEITSACRAQFKHRKITLVVPYAPGGGFDTYARAFAPLLESASAARVVVANVPGAGGVLGMRALAEAGDGDLRLGFFEAATLVQNHVRGGGMQVGQFVPLGLIATEIQAWTGRPDFSLSEYRTRPLVVAVSSAEANVIEVGLVAHALGIPFRFATGYPGSADRFAAILRREADIVSNSVTSSLQAARGGDLKPVMALTDHPVPVLPTTPVLAGPGGWIERMTAGKEAVKRAEAMRLAQVAVDLSGSFRMIFASAKLSPDNLSCMTALVHEALFSPAFADASRALGRPVEPRDAPQAVAGLRHLLKLSQENRVLLRQLLDEGLKK